MQNLRISRVSRRLCRNGGKSPAFAWDTIENSAILAYPPDQASEPLLQVKHVGFHDGTEESIAQWSAPSPSPDLPLDSVINLHYFGPEGFACLVLEGGDLVVIRPNPQHGQEKIEIVGSVDAGITAACWSPDEGLLAISTKANTFLLMTADFDAVSNTVLSSEDANLSKHVSVGWGKAETQFKGKRARALRDPTMPEKVDEGTLSPTDRGEVSISWRGDGAYVAVNAIESERRMIRIFTREGVLDSVTEPVDGQEGAFSWRPAGNLLASVQRLQDNAKVIFFERNGLRHGEFSLRLSPEDLQTWASCIRLAWNVDSTVLAVTFTDRVQLWTMGNYHYYLKQEIILSPEYGPSESALQVSWHPEEPLRLCVQEPIKTKDQLCHFVRDIALTSTVNETSTQSPHDFGTSLVIDGKTLQVTPLRKANVPPPMALHEIELESNTIDTAVNYNSSKICMLHANGVSVASYGYDTGLLPDISIPLSFDNVIPQQIALFSDDAVHVLSQEIESGRNVIVNARTQRSIFLDSASESSIFPSIDGQDLCVLNGPKVYKLESPDSDRSDEALSLVATFPSAVKTAKVVLHKSEVLAVGLAANGYLYANDRQLVKNCTSFSLTTDHIIFTTTNHLLKLIHVGSPDTLDVPPDEPERDERCRSVERGAKIVAVMPSTFSVVLQMPRGNLETIYPRALVLAAIRRNVDSKSYRKAFLACRSQRVDMNIIYDHAPQQFLSNVLLFVKQLNSVEYIDLFLSQLTDEDVSKTLYRDTLPRAGVDEPLQESENKNKASLSKEITGKVNDICDAMLAVLRGKYSTNLQNVITANVCKKPPDIVSALNVVQDLRRSDAALSDQAIEHICFLCDMNQVYDKALGIYNLDLALLIAQQSQKDPREYLPYLQGLQEMSQLRRQFTIDNDLGKRDKALLHLHALDAFDELQAYSIKYELFTQATDLYKQDERRQKLILHSYATHLNSRSRYKEAGTILESLGEYDGATQAYQASNMWQEALSCALLVPLPSEQVASLAEALAEALAEVKDYHAAATIYHDHLANVEKAAQQFCRAYRFAEASRVIARSGQHALLMSTLDPGLVEASGNATELMADCKTQLNAQVPRLRELREKKLRDPLSFIEGGPDGTAGADIPDNISLAPTDASTSGGTFMTQYTMITKTGAGSGTASTSMTRKTSKAKRREERKRARGKKGSVYEEEYLINSIGRLIERVNTVNPDIERLIEGLLRRGMRERADAVDRATIEVVELCRACIDEVYEVEKEEEAAMGRLDRDGELVRPEGGDAVLWDAIQQGKKKRVPPAVKPFAKSSLLSR